MATEVISWNPHAPGFDQPLESITLSPPVAQAQGRSRRSAKKEAKKQRVITRPLLPFVVKPDLIDVGTNGVQTYAPSRPSAVPFDLTKAFNDLARETNLQRNLRHKWNLMLTKANTTNKSSSEKKTSADYISDMQGLDSLASSIPEFCEIWNSLYSDNNKKTPFSKIVVFKKGIKPTWEDPENQKGGRFVIRGDTMEETLAIFVVIVARLMTGRLQADYNDLCGAVLQAKASDNLWIQVWNKDATDTDQIDRVKRFINKLTTRTVAYQVHDLSLQLSKSRQNFKPSTEQPTVQEQPLLAQEIVDDFVKDFLAAI